jgi:hypothetical protein
LSVAVAGVGPGVASVVQALQQSPLSRPYLELALRCAQWIDKSAQNVGGALAWPADPLKPASIGLDYYNGMPGIVVFYANLARATGDDRWRTRAEQGARYLVSQTDRAGDKLNAGLYTGLAGLVGTYMTLGRCARAGGVDGSGKGRVGETGGTGQDRGRWCGVAGFQRHYQRHCGYRIAAAPGRAEME